jgi:beta-glucosidase
VTWAARLEDYPASDPAHPERSATGVDQKTRYSEGVDVGYRWFDRNAIAPLFAFGHGLSYTRFAYSNLAIARAGDGGLDLGFTLSNSGRMDGDEVAQAYLGAPADPPPKAQFPVRALAGFARVHLKAGESRVVTLHIAPRQLQYWSLADGGWKTAPGPRTVSVGASSRDLRLSAAAPGG